MCAVDSEQSAQLICARCGRRVERSRESYETFEQMRWVCFRYEYEHDPHDPDSACQDPTCPSRIIDTDAPPDWFEERNRR